MKRKPHTTKGDEMINDKAETLQAIMYRFIWSVDLKPETVQSLEKGFKKMNADELDIFYHVLRKIT